MTARGAFILAGALNFTAGCAAPIRNSPPQAPMAQKTAQTPSAARADLSAPEESFESRVRRRANEALGAVGATPDQKTAVDELLLINTRDLYACVGGTERALLKTLSILAASQNQEEVLSALEKADIPLSDRCLMLGSDLITRFSEILSPKQREELEMTWQPEGAL